uniref:Motile sperm domain-containing protein 2 n=1 Tax=Lygus hesperus TaxID=30085 RepID=A0A146MDY3_LYGHE
MEPSYQDIQELRSKFNQRVQDENKDFHPKDLSRANSDDNWLKRFLVHHDLDKKEALNMLLDTCEWRKATKVNELNENTINREYLASGGIFIHSKDKDGKPLFVLKCAKHIKGQKDFEELKKCVIYWFERAERMGDQITIFFDMMNTGLANMDMEYTKYLINLCKLYYPNFLNYILIFEMPWVLNAAFKIIKSWLPTKAVQKIKFVNKGNLKEYVDPSQALTAWGGSDPYQFVFQPESSSGEWTKSDENKKKVHFANIQMVEVVDSSSGFDEPNKDDSISSSSMKVRLSPSDAITFAQEGIEISGALTITNTSDGPITFKVKTTSPEKFRVRPYCGALGTGASVNINVLLLSDYKPASIIQDKFLVMTLPLDTDNPSNNQINEAWKNSDTQKVEEFRLRCRVSSNVSPPGQPNGAVSASSSSTDLEQKISQLLVSMNHVNRICSEVETELKTWRRLVVIFIIVCVSFGITILYFLSNLPTSDHCHPEPEL